MIKTKYYQQSERLLRLIIFLLFFLLWLLRVQRFYFYLKLFDCFDFGIFFYVCLWIIIVGINWVRDYIEFSYKRGIYFFCCFLKLGRSFFFSYYTVRWGRSEATLVCSCFLLLFEGSLTVDSSKTEVREKLRNWLWLLME